MLDPTVLCEGPFARHELEAAASYSAEVFESGIHCALSEISLEHVRWCDSQFGPVQTRALLQGCAESLQRWHLALDTLLADMLTCTSEYTRYSKDAKIYIDMAAADYHRTRQDFEYVVTVWFLGLSPDANLGDYPPPTRTVDYLMQSLDLEG